MERLKNIFYIFSYVIMIFALLLVAVFYRQPLASTLLVFLVILPFVSLASGVYGIKRITLTAGAPSEHVEEGDEFRIRLHLKNSSPVPLLRCTLIYSFCNSYRRDNERFSLTFPGEGFASEYYNMAFKTSAAGIFEFEASEMLISDPLHFHTFKKKLDIHMLIPVMPPVVPVPDMAFSRYEGEPFDEIVSESGELTRDIRQLREYRAGDRLKDIHWKASASNGELMVKEYERSVDLQYLLLPEILKGKEEDVLRMYYSLGRKMIALNLGFRTAVYSPSDKTFRYLNVSDEDSLDESVIEIMREAASDEDVYSAFLVQNPGSTGVIRICQGSIINT